MEVSEKLGLKLQLVLAEIVELRGLDTTHDRLSFQQLFRDFFEIFDDHDVGCLTLVQGHGN
jgi:hypothetical protein